jgi:hypothetical protein
MFIVYDARIPRNDVASGTIFEGTGYEYDGNVFVAWVNLYKYDGRKL